MSNSADLLRRALGIVGSLAAASLALAYSFIINDTQPEPNGTGLPVKWNAGTVPLRLMLGDTANLSDGTSYNQSALNAVQTWNALIGSIQFSPSTSTATPAGGNRANELSFAATIYGRNFDEDTLAVTTGTQIGNERIEADIIFNTAYTWDSYRGNARGSGSSLTPDIRRVALHELGHVLGLDHPNEDGQQVDAIMNSRIGNRDALSQDDTAGAQQLYGNKLVPANDDFANAQVIASTPFSVQSVNTLATKQSGEPAHAGNAGGHSVWYRWTAPAGGTVTLDTKGSYYDTTLGVYTGTQIAGLVVVASDDDIEDGVTQASELTFTAIAGTTYHIAVDGFDGDTGGFRLSLTVDGVTGSAPIISNHPLSIIRNVSNGAGFSVTATGTSPLTYQWYFNNEAIAGATADTYTINNVTTANAGSYHCVVSNALGSATSNTATLTVTQAPTPAPTPPSSGGGGGGGGAPSLWFVAVLAALGLARACARRSVRNP